MMQLKLGATIAAMVFAFPLARAGDWTQFRGPQGMAVSEETGLPVKWNEKEGLRWKADLPGRGLSNPVIAGGRVYVTASSGYRENKLHVLAFDLATGKRLWERTFYSTGSTQCHPKTCMAAPTPVTDGKAVYALFATADLAALDADGNLLWYRSLVRDYPTITNQVGMASSPVLHKDVLMVPMDNAGESFLAGIDKKTGKNLWKIERHRDINFVTPLIVPRGDRAEIVFPSAKELAAYDVDTGRKAWSYQAAEVASDIPSPVAGKDFLLIPGKELVCLKPPVDKTTPEIVWKTSEMKTGFMTPLLYRDRIYGVNSAGVLLCVDAADGKMLWKQRLKGTFSASAVAADGKIYVVNEEGTTFVVDADAEGKVLATNELKDTMLATPALADGAVFLRSDKALYCIGAKK
ncbi:MAG TPA: PQQ-binding-like beta-propeller repeat protein [Gemmataceae bacterium]|jgi:glucose dehydrogenase